MSVRLRLTLWYVAALCLGLGVFGGAVLWQTERAATATLDTALRQRARDVAADLRLDHGLVLRPDAPDEGTGHLGEATLWVRVLDLRGRVVVRQGPPLPGVPAAVLAATRPGLYNHELGGDRQVRLFVDAVVSNGRRVATVQIITTTGQIEAARRQLLAAMTAAGALIVLAAAGGGLFLASRTLQPVDRITQLAASIGARDLHRRVGDTVPANAARSRHRTDELGRLIQTFDAMLARLEEADTRRRRFTADVAHELGTPIATIVSGAEIALRQRRSADEYRVALQHVLDESRHMGRIVDDLLLLARADAGRLPLEREIVEIDEVCQQATRALQPLAQERGVTLRVLVPPTAVLVLGDEGRLGQVVRNLLDNALRYTARGGTVTLSLEEQPRQTTGGGVIVRVRDTGPGIAPRDRERIFERFHRGEAARGSNESEGSGLGLAICHAIVMAHGGRIHVGENDVAPGGHGAEFVVTLPAFAEEMACVPASGGATSSPRRS